MFQSFKVQTKIVIQSVDFHPSQLEFGSGKISNDKF